ncbi:hypothetical protein H5410_013164 [Solanum commersonii]|uniref:Uncharacterized protein n=1 Tax=Solanum commersonii TaxID=4109 RepID=A0A9J6AUN8_SOLCO|nr:hypothetical protein H5410_013164 [Solanum commersonii]
MKLDLGVDINYQMAWRAKEKALDSIMGPIIVVDACHLKSAYTGAFVSASTLDGAGMCDI